MFTMDLLNEYNISSEYIDLSNRNLISVQGLEKFTNVKRLNLSGNLLTDYTFLHHLKNLTHLDLSFNQFKTIELNSPYIKSINLRGNCLSSIQFLSSFTYLSKLNLRGNCIKYLQPLTKLKRLESLNIRGNKVSSIEFLIENINIKKLDLRNNRIKSIKSLANLPLLNQLYIQGNDIYDLHLLTDKFKAFKDCDFIIDIPEPKFEKESGFYNAPLSIKINSEMDHEIYYTLDGSRPTTNAKKYDKPIKITKNLIQDLPINANNKTSPLHDGFSFSNSEIRKAVTVTAVAFNDGKYSKPSSSTYIFKSSCNLPIVSLIIDPNDLFDDQKGIYVPGIRYKRGQHGTGNYYGRGRNFEKKGAIEFFHRNGTLNFKQNIGVRINGSYTRRFPQKSLRIYARNEYGKSRIHTDLFKDLSYNEFKLLVLRNSGDDHRSTLLRDGLMHELVKNLPVDVQAYEPAVVLLNGEYWGIHNIREKFNDNYINIKYNIRKQDIVLMKVNNQNGLEFGIKTGTQTDKAHYEQLLSYVKKERLSNLDLNQIEMLMDIENYLHYIAYQIYYANTDSFSNNLMLWRKRTSYTPNAPLGHDGRWRWMLYDLDWGMGYGLLNIEGDPLHYNMIEHILNKQQGTEVFKGLMKNKKAKDRFHRIMLTLLDTNFKPSNVKEKINELSSNIRPEIPQSIKRWKNIESSQKWEENIEVLLEFAERRPQIVKEHLMKYLN